MPNLGRHPALASTKDANFVPISLHLHRKIKISDLQGEAVGVKWVLRLNVEVNYLVSVEEY